MRQRLPGRHALTVSILLLIIGLGTAILIVPGAVAQDEEPNDEIDTANPIEPGETVTGDVPEGDKDYFAIDVEAGQTINVSTTIGEGDGLKVAIFDPYGNQLGGVRGGQGTILGGATAAESGTHYVRIRHWNGNDVTPYEMTVETYETTDREPNEDMGNATRINTGEEIQDQRSLGDTDWYAFDAEAGETINLTGYVGPGSGLRFNIIRADGESIQREGGSDAQLHDGVTATYSGTYYLRLRKSGGGLTGMYNFSVSTYETTDREPNEDPGNATRLDPPASVEDTISLGDEDYYAVDLQAGQSINVSGTVGPEAGNEIRIQAPNGTNLNKTQLSDGSYTVSADAVETGTHYVKVNRNSWPGADYTLDVEVPGAGTDGQASTDNGGSTDGGQEEDQEDGDGGGLPILPIALVLALILIGAFLWMRRDESDDEPPGQR
jgi:hypothetical protein